MSDQSLTIKFKKLQYLAKMPCKAHSTDAGFDLFASENTTIPARGNALVHLSIAMVIPDGYCAIIKDRSGLAVKNCIYTRAGVIDSAYRGEVKVVIENGTNNNYEVEEGTKIAQMLILPVPAITFEEVISLDESDRGTGGFGSTGN